MLAEEFAVLRMLRRACNGYFLMVDGFVVFGQGGIQISRQFTRHTAIVQYAGQRTPITNILWIVGYQFGEELLGTIVCSIGLRVVSLPGKCLGQIVPRDSQVAAELHNSGSLAY